MIIDVSNNDQLQGVLSRGLPVLLLFTDPSWCMPCRAFEPHFERAEEVADGWNFVRVTLADADPALVQEYGVMGVPTTIAYVGGAWYDVKARAVIPLIKELSELTQE